MIVIKSQVSEFCNSWWITFIKDNWVFLNTLELLTMPHQKKQVAIWLYFDFKMKQALKSQNNAILEFIPQNYVMG